MPPSPHRKHPTSAMPPLTAPDHHPPLLPEGTTPPLASDSPRTLVARTFSTLELHDTLTPRKRARLASPAPPPPRLTPPTSPANGLAITFAPAPAPDAVLPCTPSATPHASPLKPKPASPPRRQRRRLRSPSPRSEGLAWSAAEITGHVIDRAAEDDGEGINGLGFVPSAAEAEKRRQRRREQVSEWRAREAREERRRRCERRRGEGRNGGAEKGEGGNGERERGRGVRFEGAD